MRPRGALRALASGEGEKRTLTEVPALRKALSASFTAIKVCHESACNRAPARRGALSESFEMQARQCVLCRAGHSQPDYLLWPRPLSELDARVANSARARAPARRGTLSTAQTLAHTASVKRPCSTVRRRRPHPAPRPRPPTTTRCVARSGQECATNAAQGEHATHPGARVALLHEQLPLD